MPNTPMRQDEVNAEIIRLLKIIGFACCMIFFELTMFLAIVPWTRR